QLESVGCRLILCGRPPVPSLPQVPSVDYDNAQGVRGLTEHLIELGHEQIAFITGGPETTRRARRAGYRDAMAAAALEPIEVGDQAWEVTDGMAAARELLDRRPCRRTPPRPG